MTASTWPDPQREAVNLLTEPSMIGLEHAAKFLLRRDPTIDITIPVDKLVALFAVARHASADLATTASVHAAAGATAMREAAVRAVGGISVDEGTKEERDAADEMLRYTEALIRVLPIPDASALDAVIAEAEERGAAKEGVPTEVEIAKALVWLTHYQHMRKTDRINALRNAYQDIRTTIRARATPTQETA